MTPPLPDHPSIEHLRKQAKDILKAQRNGDSAGCQILRRLRNFADASDEQVLAARVTLKEAQFALAMDCGFASWLEMRDHVRAERLSDAATLEAVRLRCPHEIPEYAAGGVPLGVVAALNHAGVDIDFMEFAAATGWAFSFGYKYGDISPAFMAVRGNPKADGPFEVFAFLPTRLGFDYEMAPTQDHDKLWAFVTTHVDAGTPIMSEHLDGGLISGYRRQNGARQIYFDGSVAPGWTDVADLHPYGVYVLVKRGQAAPKDEIAREALARAVSKGSAHEVGGVPQGLAALEAYLADVSDQSKDFADCAEWFCWAAFERLTARRCCQEWLRSVADELPPAARGPILQAADDYGKAFEHYDRYRAQVLGGEPTPLSLRERARTAGRIAAIAPILEQGIEAERAGIENIKSALKA